MEVSNRLVNLDAYEIQTYQQNRYPLLFIDYTEKLMTLFFFCFLFVKL